MFVAGATLHGGLRNSAAEPTGSAEEFNFAFQPAGELASLPNLSGFL